MEHFSCGHREAAECLCIHASAAGCGILFGVLFFFLWGEHAEIDAFSELYFQTRAFSSYADAHAYMEFFASWFCHHALWQAAALLCAFFVRPMVGTLPLCFARGLLAGFGICVLSGSFSGFVLYYAAAQAALLALLLMMSAKSIRYAKDRALYVKNMGGTFLISQAWVFGKLLPLLCGFFLSCGVQILGMLGISCASVWLFTP